jgi:type IV pilus assembly protein PilO
MAQINLSLGKLPWYAQVGVFFALALGAAGAFWHFYAVPAQESIDQRSTQLASIRADISRGLATARRLPEFRREVAQLEAQLDRLRAVLPEDQDVAELLRRVQAMATQSNLTIRTFSPQAVAKQQLHAEWPFGLQLEGTYHDLGAFLDRVSKFPRIINVNNLKIRAREAQPGGQQGGSGTIVAECTAKTFVLLESKPAAAKPAVPGQPAGAPAKTE